LLCPRLPGANTGNFADRRTCDAELHSAGGPDVSLRAVSHLPRPKSPQPTWNTTA